MIKSVINCFTVLLCFCWLNADAQSPYAASEQFTDNSSQGNFGTGHGNIVNVDMFTGIPSVSIPIYNCVVDGVDASVSLTYTCQAMQVDQMPSSIGLGWNLQAGGYIVRQVNGVEDECVVPMDSIYEYYWDPRIQPDTLFDVLTYVAGNWISPSPSSHAIYDHQPDGFTAVYAGKTLRFAIDDNAPPYPVGDRFYSLPRDGSYVAKTLVDSVNGKVTFTLLDALGNQFLFSEGDYEQKYIPSVNQTYYPTERWVLNKIITTGGKTISYKYSTYHVSYPIYQEQSILERLVTGNNWYVDTVNDSAKTWTGQISQLSEIDYPNGVKVVFNTSNVSRCDMNNNDVIRSITIKDTLDANNHNAITYQLNQAYFNTPVSGTTIFAKNEVPFDTFGTSTCPTYKTMLGYPLLPNANAQLTKGLRLKLKGITKIGADGSSEPYYSFSYSDTALPLRLSPMQDLYGNYNNQPVTPYTSFSGTHYLAVPYHQCVDEDGHPYSYGTGKSPFFNYAQAFILNKVTNPLGGITNIYYQSPPNLTTVSLSESPTANFPYTDAGNDGVCVSRIVDHDGFNADDSVTTAYTFTNGNRFYPGTYFWYPAVYYTDPHAGSAAIYKRVYTNHYVSPMDFYGANHGYTNVTEKKTGFNNELISRTDYVFSNLSSNPGYMSLEKNDPNGLDIVHPRQSFSQYQLGILQEKDEYGSSAAIMRKHIYRYSIPANSSIGIIDTDYFAYRYFTADMAGVVDSTVQDYDYNTYDVFDGLYQKTLEVNTVIDSTFSGTANSANVTRYTYNSDANIDSVKWSDGVSNYQRFLFYPGPIAVMYDNLVDTSTGYVYDSLQTSIYYNSLLPLNRNCVLGEETLKLPDTVLSFSEILPADTGYTHGRFAIKQEAHATIGSPTVDSQFHSPVGSYISGGGPYVYGWYNTVFNFNQYVANIANYTAYDDQLNVLEKWSNNNQQVSSAIYETQTGNNLADVANAQYRDIAFTSFESKYTAYGTRDYNKGNWDFSPTNIVYTTGASSPKAMTGHYYCSLASGVTINSIYALQLGKKYLLTFWCDVPPRIIEAGTTYPATLITSVGSWSLYSATITGGNGALFISGPTGGCKIDELRLHPVDASMISKTYEPLFGISSAADERNNIIYTEYDGMGRPRLTRDINGNIITLQKTVVQGNDN